MAQTPAPNRIDRRFAEARAARRPLLVLFLPAGYPDAATTAAILAVLPGAGADLIELGVPFSDPIADGPVIQQASTAALAGGMTLDGALALARAFRAADAETPLVLFGALNPFAIRGEAAAAAAAAAAGADGLLAADMPVEEAAPLRAACAANGMHLISLIAPTTPPARIAAIAAASSGFLYCIARKGVTGTHSKAESPEAYLGRIRAQTTLPLALGFGIATPADAAAAAAAGADAVVVGSALIETIDRALATGASPAAAAREYVASLAAALRPGR